MRDRFDMADTHLTEPAPAIAPVTELADEDTVGAELPSQNESWRRIAVIGAAVVGISGLRFLVDERLFAWQNAVHHLYALPIMYAALRFGWRGGLITTAAAAVLYLPHALAMHSAQPFPGYLVSRIVALLEFCLAATVIGVLSERDRRQRRALMQTTKRLNHVYNELQGNYERMKQSERLYAAGELSAGLAHEIRNPIASIAGAAELLERNADSEQRRRDCLHIISKECNRLNHLLTSFMDFAKPRQPMFQVIAVGPIVTSAIELAGHAIGRQPIALRQDVGPDIPPVECDAEQIKQVLLNLLLNAIQAMPHGGEIVVSAHSRNSEVVITVRDQGCGISRENLGRLFDPFFTTKETGTGLGLSVAHRIIAQHSGSLAANPNPGGGTTFSVRLPLKRVEAR